MKWRGRPDAGSRAAEDESTHSFEYRQAQEEPSMGVETTQTLTVEDEEEALAVEAYSHPVRSRSLSPPRGGGWQLQGQLAFASGPGPLPEGTPIIVHPAPPALQPPPPQLLMPMGSPYPHSPVGGMGMSPPPPPHLLQPAHRAPSPRRSHLSPGRLPPPPPASTQTTAPVPVAEVVKGGSPGRRSLADELKAAEVAEATPEDPPGSGRRKAASKKEKKEKEKEKKAGKSRAERVADIERRVAEAEAEMVAVREAKESQAQAAKEADLKSAVDQETRLVHSSYGSLDGSKALEAYGVINADEDEDIDRSFCGVFCPCFKRRGEAREKQKLSRKDSDESYGAIF